MSQKTAQDAKVTDRISFKLARVSILAALSVGLFMSAIQVYLDYLEADERLEQIVNESLEAVEKAATRSVLMIDAELADEVISGLFEYRHIASARILDENNNELAAAKRTTDQYSDIKTFAQLTGGHTRVISRDLVLEEYISGDPGHLEVVVDRSVGLLSFFDRATATIVSSIIHSIMLAGVLYVAFHRGITRPLLSLLYKLSNIDPEYPGEQRISVSKRHKRDELGQLGAQINLSFDAVQVLLDNLRSTNRALTSSEEALRRRSWELEQEVERTKQATLELITTKEQAEAANRAKSVLLANVSHELQIGLRRGGRSHKV